MDLHKEKSGLTPERAEFQFLSIAKKLKRYGNHLFALRVSCTHTHTHTHRERDKQTHTYIHTYMCVHAHTLNLESPIINDDRDFLGTLASLDVTRGHFVSASQDKTRMSLQVNLSAKVSSSVALKR